MFEISITIHAIFAAVFVLYIMLDRMYIRVFMTEEKRGIFYNKVKWPMLLICTILIISGKVLLIYAFSIMYVFKAILGLILIFSFFYCPVFMKKEVHAFRRFMYRYFVVILMIMAVGLGLYL